MDNEQNTRRTAYEKEILAIADEMAASVTALTPQTYDTSISSRENELFGGYLSYDLLLKVQKEVKYFPLELRKFVAASSLKYLPIGFL